MPAVASMTCGGWGQQCFFVWRKGVFFCPGWLCFATGGGRVKVARSAPVLAGCLDAAEHGARVKGWDWYVVVDARLRGHDEFF